MWPVEEREQINGAENWTGVPWKAELIKRDGQILSKFNIQGKRVQAKVSRNGSLTHSLETRSIFCQLKVLLIFLVTVFHVKTPGFSTSPYCHFFLRKCNLFSSFLYITSFSQQHAVKPRGEPISIFLHFFSSYFHLIQNPHSHPRIIHYEKF